MGDVQSLAMAGSSAPSLWPQTRASGRAIDSTKCGLCGVTLSARTLRHRVLSPHRADVKLTVCHMCRNVALGVGYWPAG